jgi:outer membrane lipoprotein-sorting protein
MIVFLLIWGAMAVQSADVISSAIENYGQVASYKVTLRSRNEESSEKIRYFYKKPGYVRMEFVEPHNGSVLVYDPTTNEVKVRPFGFIKALVFTLSPDNRLIKSSKGHTVDESDIGALLEMVHTLKMNGTVEVLGNKRIGNKRIGERETIKVKVTGRDGFAVDSNINCYLLWMDTGSFLPIKVSAYDKDGDLIEEVLMDDLEINIELGSGFFEL